MTKKEQAKKELMALPMVSLEKVTVPGPKWHAYALCCRINGVLYLQPKDFFKTNWVSEHLNKGDFGPQEAIPIRSGAGPFTWIVSVATLDRLYDQIVDEVSYFDDSNKLRGKIHTLMNYKGSLPELTLSDAEIEEAKQHVANRNSLLQEAKQEQNEQLSSVVGNADGDQLRNYDLTMGTLNKLERAGITTVEQLMSWNRLDLLKIGGFGRKALTEVDDAKELYGWERNSYNPAVEAEKELSEEETLQQLVDRIEAMGWEVSLRRKRDE